MKKFFWIFLLINIIFLLSVTSFFFYIQNKKSDSYDSLLLATSSEEEKLSPNATFGLKKYYDECNHFEYEEAELPTELVNLTRQEIEDYYYEWEVAEFASDKLVLMKEINGYCNNHYLIKLTNNYINIYKLLTNGNQSFLKQTEISRDFLTNGDIETLESGIMIYGQDKISEVLEDYE